MHPVKRTGIATLCVVCAAETAAIIAYYGAPVIRMTLAALIGLVIVTGMVSALRAARRGDLIREHDTSPAPESARIYYLPRASQSGAARENDVTLADHSRRVIRLDDR